MNATTFTDYDRATTGIERFETVHGQLNETVKTRARIWLTREYARGRVVSPHDECNLIFDVIKSDTLRRWRQVGL